MGQLVFQAALGGAVNLIGPNISATTNFTLPGADGTNGQALTTNGSGVLGFSSIVSGAAGSNTQVQFNSGGNFGASASLTWDGTNLTSTGFSGPHNGTVGATTANTGNFTTLTTSSTVTLNGGTANGVTYLNGSKVLTSGSALTFNGALLTQTVADAATSTKWSGDTGKVRLRPYTDSTNGAIFDSTNAAESAYLPLSLFASNINYSADTASIWKIAGSEGMRLTSTGLGIGTSSPGYKLTVAGTSGTAIVSLLETGVRSWGIRAGGAATNTFDIADFTAGVTRLTIDSAGNLGIGTSSPTDKLQVVNTTDAKGINIGFAVTPTGTNGGALTFSAYTNASTLVNQAQIKSVCINGSASYASNLLFATSSAGALNATQMTLDSAGNLGLGVTPSAWGTSWKAFDFSNRGGLASGFDETDLNNNVYRINTGAYYYKQTAAATTYNQSGGAHLWLTAASGTAGTAITFTQALTLDASGNLLIGRTTVPVQNTAGTGIQNNGLIITESSQTQGGLWVNRITSDGNAVYFTRQNSLVGTISVTGSATAYNTSSDYRLKNITGPITTSGAYIDSLNPVEGTWKADGTTFVGLIAHEVQEASRTQVATGTKDGDEMQAMDYSNSELIANLIAEVKSLRQRVATLEAK